MSDIDFDELDKAVASVLNTGGPADLAAPEPSPAYEPPASPEPSLGSQPTTVTVKQPAAASAQSLHAQPVKPVQRGRFLDMVHPSATRKQPGQAGNRSAPSSSNGAFVSDVIAPRPAAAPATAPAAATTTLPVRTPAADTSGPAADAPDFFAASPDDASPHKAPVTDTDKPGESPISPFIPDAKVQKRPLGALNGSDASTSFSLPSSLPTGEALDKRLAEIEGEDNVTAVVTADTAKPTPDTSPAAAPVRQPEPVGSKRSVAPVSTDIAPAAVPTSQSVAVPDASLFGDDLAATLPKPRRARAPKYGRGTFIWLTVAVAVMLIGFGVGASLYILLLR